MIPRRHDDRVKPYINYEIRAAMASDQGSSITYLFDEQENDATRVYLRIKRKGRAVVWCEGVINSDNYRGRYNAPELRCNAPRRQVQPGGAPKPAEGSNGSDQRDSSRAPGRKPIPADPAKTVTMGAWYRELLGIEHAGGPEALRIKVYERRRGRPWYDPRRWQPSRAWWGAVQVTLKHPVSTNRIAMWFALLGAALGIVSLVIAFVAA